MRSNNNRLRNNKLNNNKNNNRKLNNNRNPNRNNNVRIRNIFTNNKNKKVIPNRINNNRFNRNRIVPRFIKFTNLKPKSNNQRINIAKNNKKNNNNTKFNNNYMNSKIRYLINPMQAVLNQKYFSIYPTAERVIRMGIFTKNNLVIENNRKINLYWYPRGVGFSATCDYLQVTVDAQGNKRNVDSFTNLWCMEGDVYNQNAVITPFNMNMCNIKGRFRVIGAELKITNVTNAVSRGGSFIAGEIVSELSTPFYYVKELLYNHTNLHYYGNGLASLIEVKDLSVDNVANKQMYSANDIALLRYVGLDQNAKLFSNFNEFMCSEYIDWGAKIQGVIYTADGLAMPDDVYGKTNHLMGTNNVFKIVFDKPNYEQVYLLEHYLVIEVIPDATTNLGSAAVKSTVKLSNNQRRQLENMPKCVRA